MLKVFSTSENLGIIFEYIDLILHVTQGIFKPHFFSVIAEGITQYKLHGCLQYTYLNTMEKSKV